MIPAACAVRSLAGLKLFGNARHSHVMSSVLDEGLALFAGLNVIPKRSFLDRVQLPHRPGLLPEADARLVRRRQRPGPEAGDVVRPRLPHDPLPRRRRAGREALRFQAEPPPEGNAGLPGPGRRHTRLLLRQRRAAQGPAERRDPPLRRLLEAADRPPPRGTDLRLQADDLRQPQPAEPDGDPVHHAAATLPEAARRGGQDPAVGLATDRAGERLPRVQDTRGSWTAGSR